MRMVKSAGVKLVVTITRTFTNAVVAWFSVRVVVNLCKELVTVSGYACSTKLAPALFLSVIAKPACEPLGRLPATIFK